MICLSLAFYGTCVLHYVQSVAIVVEMSKRLFLCACGLCFTIRLSAYLVKVMPINFMVPETRRQEWLYKDVKHGYIYIYGKVSILLLHSVTGISQETRGNWKIISRQIFPHTYRKACGLFVCLRGNLLNVCGLFTKFGGGYEWFTDSDKQNRNKIFNHKQMSGEIWNVLLFARMLVRVLANCIGCSFDFDRFFVVFKPFCLCPCVTVSTEFLNELQGTSI